MNWNWLFVVLMMLCCGMHLFKHLFGGHQHGRELKPGHDEGRELKDKLEEELAQSSQR